METFNFDVIYTFILHRLYVLLIYIEHQNLIQMHWSFFSVLIKLASLDINFWSTEICTVYFVIGIVYYWLTIYSYKCHLLCHCCII